MAIHTPTIPPVAAAAPATLNPLANGAPAETDGPKPLRWTREEYYRLAEAGFFTNRRVMLIEGEVYVKCPQNEPYVQGINFTRHAVEGAFGDQFTARIQAPLFLNQSTDPEPDVAMVPGPFRSQPSTAPTSALLIVEVADTSLWYDTGDKASLYAAGGIADYWVVDLNRGQLIVFRDPQADASAKYGHSYFQRTILGRGKSIAPLAVPTTPVAVADLLP